MKKQLSLFDKNTEKKNNRVTHGGSKPSGRRKEERPLSTKKWLHVVLKSDKPKEQFSLLSARNQIWIQVYIAEMARRYGIAIGDYVNGGDHLHLKVRASSRALFKRFLRAITGRIAAHVTGARKGKSFGRFWRGLAFTRILKSSLEELQLRGYFEANRIEVLEGYEKREEFLKEFNARINRLRKGNGFTRVAPESA